MTYTGRSGEIVAAAGISREVFGMRMDTPIRKMGKWRLLWLTALFTVMTAVLAYFCVKNDFEFEAVFLCASSAFLGLYSGYYALVKWRF